ncbi:MAG: hypothetical protein MK312_02335 [Roseibacillus sp.]|nr:hypothetical protein [Roseibacillus sp.]
MANLKASRLWQEGIPETLFFMGWTDFTDQSLDAQQLRNKIPYPAALRKYYERSIDRHFDRFQISD